MSKDNSFLYSGITSASSDIKTKRETQREAKIEDQIKLKPAADVVLELIQKERDAITDIRSIILDRSTTAQEINTDLIARKLYVGYLNGLESKIKRILTVRPSKEEPSDD